MTDTSHQQDAPDWEWNGLMEPGAVMSGLRDIEGSRIGLVDADLCPHTQGWDIGSCMFFALVTSEIWLPFYTRGWQMIYIDFQLSPQLIHLLIVRKKVYIGYVAA